MNLCEKVAFIALKDTKGPEIWLEASTERSESNPERSLGIIKQEGTAVWKTVPPCCAPSPSAQSARVQKVHG